MNPPIPASELVQALKDRLLPEEIAQRFQGRSITGDVDLRGVEYPHRLTLKECTFDGSVDAEDARFRKSVDFSRCKFEKGLKLDGAEFGGTLILDEANVQPIPGLRRILSPTRNEYTLVALSLRQIRVRRSLSGDCLSTQGTILLTEANVSHQVSFCGVQIQEGELDLQNIHVGADIFCRSVSKNDPPTNVGLQMWMYGAKIGADLDIRGVTIEGDLSLENARIGADFLARTGRPEQSDEDYLGSPRTKIGGAIYLQGSKVGGLIDVSSAYIEDDLVMENCHFASNILGLTPEVTREATYIGGRLVLDSTRVDGVVKFVGARILGDVSAVRGIFDDGFYLSAITDEESEKCHPHRTTHIGPEATSGPRRRWTAVDLSHAKVNGVLSFLGSAIAGEVNLHAAQVVGSLLAGGVERHTTVTGPVIADTIRVSGRADFRNLTVQHSDIIPAQSSDPLPCLNLRFANIQGNCHLPGDEKLMRHISIFHAKFGEVNVECEDKRSDLPKSIRRLVVRPSVSYYTDTISFRKMSLPEDNFIAFLEQTDPFQKGTYQVIEKHLREIGQDIEADLVYRQMRRRERRQDAGIFSLIIDVMIYEVFCPLISVLFLHPLDRRTYRYVSHFFGEFRKLPGGRVVEYRYRRRLEHSGSRLKSIWQVFYQPNTPWLRRRLFMILMLLLCVSLCVYGNYIYVCIPLVPLLFGMRWLWEFMLDVITGYGTESWRLGLYLIVVFVGFWYLFSSNPNSVRRVVDPTQREVDTVADRVAFHQNFDQRLALIGSLGGVYPQHPEDSTLPPAEVDYSPTDLGKEWTRGDAFFVSLRTTIPLIEFVTDKDWEPSDAPVECVGQSWQPFRWTTYEKLAGFFSALSYVAIPLFLASLSGWLKRRGE